MYKVILILLVAQFFVAGCRSDESLLPGQRDYRMEMRDFVGALSAYSKGSNSKFLIVPQNGQELVTENGEVNGILQQQYLKSIDATGREDLFYGYVQDDKETPVDDSQHLLELCLLYEQNGVEVLTTDYCCTPEKIDNSYFLNEQNGFISYAADERELNKISTYPVRPYNENADDIDYVSKARNFLYLINGDKFNTKQDMINAISSTNFDVVIIDLFQNGIEFSAEEVNQLKIKKNGGFRLAICYMSIGEAEDYRYYWQEDWSTNPPSWLEAENPDWEGNFKVKYWEPEWQAIIFGNDSSYLNRILNAGFDGAYLDIVDGYEYFEEN